MSPASGGGRPGPARAYALWLDSLNRAGWAADPRARAGWASDPPAEEMPVGDALGRVTAEAVVARWPSPRSDCAAMDGIAVSAAALSAAVLATAPAGQGTAGDRATRGRTGEGADSGADGSGPDGDRADHGWAAGGAVIMPAGAFEWIDTGDPMPDGADTVVVREWLLPQADGGVVIAMPAPPASPPPPAIAAAGHNVRRRGEDFAAGEVLVPAGRLLRPGDLAAAAAGGYVSLAVTRRPVVAIIPTGDEIRPAGAPLRRSDIIDTSSIMLAARCRQVGATPVVSDVQPDDPDALAAEIRRAALGADLVLVIAGSSRGRGDHAAGVLAQVGGVAVAGVAVRPGHPALLGHVKRPPSDRAVSRAGIAPVIGLPGYPLATAVIFELFAVELLASVGGVDKAARHPLLASLDRDWSSPRGLEEWVLVTLATAASPDGGNALPVASPARRGAGAISQLARADAWWRIPADQDALPAGTEIEIRPI